MKTLLITISTTALLLIGQSAMALEQISSENGYDPAFKNGRVSEANMVLPTASYRSDTADALGFSGGSENDTGKITPSSTFEFNHAAPLRFSGGSENDPI